MKYQEEPGSQDVGRMTKTKADTRSGLREAEHKQWEERMLRRKI
jgi:hypothetical protein